MPSLSKEHRALLHSLAKTHASNAIIKRQVARGIHAAKKELSHQVQRGISSARRGATKYIKSGGLGRDIKRYGAKAMMSGMGEYHLRSRDGGAMPKPRISKRSGLEKGEMVICHSEYLGELLSGTANPSAFTSQNYGINAGNPGTFPWLSTIANSFQNYKFKKLIFEFRPLCPDAVTGASGNLVSMGSVILATQYDSVIGPFLNKAQMENSDYGESCKPSEHVMHAVECNPKYNPLGEYYVSAEVGFQTTNATGSSTTDIRFQNMGIFQIASVGQPTAGGSAIDLGEIWVHYEVELLKPTTLGPLDAIQSAHYDCSGTFVITGSPGTAWFGTSQVGSSDNQLPLAFPTNSSFAFPLAITQGKYLCVYNVAGFSGAVTTTQSVTPTVANGSLVQAFVGSGGGAFDNSAVAVGSVITAQTTQNFTICFIVQVNAPGNALCTVTMPASGFTAATATRADLIVTPYNISME